MTQPSFERVLVGVDGSPESVEAARQAALLADPDGALTLLAVYDVAPAVVGGTGSQVPAYFDEDAQRRGAEEALERTRRELAQAVEPVTKVARGNAWDELLSEIEREGHRLVAVGSHGKGRLRGILLGSVAAELIHKAPCSVLVAREARAARPSRIVVGIDGSPGSDVAHATARRLAERFEAELTPIAAAESPVDELVAAAADADLVVVGSRGLHGLKSLGSVSERVAHHARASVLIVRH